MASLVPNPDDLLKLGVEGQGCLILKLLAGYDSPQKPVAHSNFFNRANDYAARPPYGNRQKEADQALLSAWGWLENNGSLTKTPSSGGGTWVFVSKAGKELLALDELNALLQETPQGRRDAGWWGRARGAIERWKPAKSEEAKTAEDLFFAHLNAVFKEADERRRGENQMLALLNQVKHGLGHGRAESVPPGDFTLVAQSRVDELRELASLQFDLKKLIRLCEEINSSYSNGNYLATAMLTRSLLDHVPPLFGKNNFGEVASNYGGASFKGTMQHLQNASRNVADGHLHQQIRNSESLPTAQQVNCGQQLDTLLAEIVRVTK